MARPKEGEFVKVTYSGKADQAVLDQARAKAKNIEITFSKLLEKLMIGFNEGKYKVQNKK
jgi:hypothetical protein